MVADAAMLDCSMSEAPPKAVFLSYASQDADAVSRVRDGLEAAGIEVWFDQSELRGGDAWDAAIRKRIKECVLFVPVVSPATDARDEGYFRLEWKLAVDRSHLFAGDKPFLLPVTLDGASQQRARVPDRFHEVQWSRVAQLEEIAAFAEHVAGLLNATAAPPRAQTAAATRAIEAAPSIAVLPFVNMSSDADNEYFADGLSEELLNVLANIRGLRVASRTSAFFFKGKEADLATIAHKLGVATVLEGSVRRVGKRVRITAQLIEIATDTHLWSRSYDRELDDIFAVQDDIAQAVVAELKGKLLAGRGKPPAAQAASEVKAAALGRTDNPQAHELYLQARFRLNHWTSEANARAAEMLERAVTLDPDFALAWAALSTVAFSLAAYDSVPSAPGVERARAAALKALELEPGLAEAHVCLSRVLTVDWDWQGATASLDRARELAPNNPQVLRAMGRHLGYLGRHDEATEYLRQAVIVDPLAPASHFNLGGRLLYAGRLEEAEASYKRALELNPTGGLTHAGPALVYLVQGRFEDALRMIADEIVPLAKLSLTAMIEHSLGYRERSDEALAALIGGHHENGKYMVASVYAWRGEPEPAFEWLERAYASREPSIAGMLDDPLLANLAPDPRWQAMLKRIGLSSPA